MARPYTGGSAIGLSATDAWAEPLPVISTMRLIPSISEFFLPQDKENQKDLIDENLRKSPSLATVI